MANDFGDADYMSEALKIATVRGSDPKLSPIGCIIVRDGKILASARNRVEEDHDPTAHAEIVAIRAATAKLGLPELRGTTLYSTLQPCGMCTMASIWAKVRHIVYGAGRADVHDMYFEDRHVNTLDFVADAFRDDITIKGGVRRFECASLYYRPGDNPPLEEQGNL